MIWDILNLLLPCVYLTKIKPIITKIKQLALAIWQAIEIALKLANSKMGRPLRLTKASK